METPEIDDTATRNAKHGPNFLLIVILFAIAILVVLVASFFTLDWAGKRLVRRDQRPPNSRLVMPASSLQGHAQVRS